MPFISREPTGADVLDDKHIANTTLLISDSAALESQGTSAPSLPTRKAWMKMDLVLLPIITLMLFASILDQSSIANARIAGLQRSLHMSDKQFTIVLSLQVIPAMLVQIPANYLYIVLGPRVLLSTIMVLAGILGTMQGFVTSFAGLIVCRVIISLAAGGFSAVANMCLSAFYPRHMLQLRVSVVYSALPLSLAFSSLLAAAIVSLNGMGGKPGWAWLFILEGLFCVALGLVSYFVIPNAPATSWFLVEDERRVVTCALSDDGLLDSQEEEPAGFWSELCSTVRLPHVLLLTLIGFSVDLVLAGLASFLPTLVVALGHEGTQAQLLSAPPWLVGGILSLVSGYISDRYSYRGWTVVVSACISAVGFAIFLGSYDDSARYASLFLCVAGACTYGPALTAWLLNNTAPLLRRAIAMSLSSIMTRFGSILAAQLFGTLSPPPRFTAATVTLLAFQIGTILCAACTMVYLARENGRRKRAREAIIFSAGADVPAHVQACEGPVSTDSVWFSYVM